MSELQDQYKNCNSILNLVRDNEVWLITNIANTIAERSEKIDSANRNIKFLEEHGNKHFSSRDNEEKRKYSLIVESNKEFINDLHSLIQELQKISDSKFQEVQRLKKSIKQMKNQYKVLIRQSLISYHKVIDRLFELQNHYRLPPIMSSRQDMLGQSNAINASLNVYLKDNKIRTDDYYNRCLELYQGSIIYSDERTKVFYNTFLLLVNNMIIDAMIIDEYISTNSCNSYDVLEHINENDYMDQFGSLSPTSSISPFKGAKCVGFNEKKHVHVIEESTDKILNDVFTPISLNPSVRSTSFAPLQDEYQNDMIKDKKSNPMKLLKHVLTGNEFNITFESINLLGQLNTSMINKNKQKYINKDTNYDLLKRIKIISYFGYLLQFERL